MSTTGKSTERESTLVVARDLEEREMGVNTNGYEVYFWGDKSL